MKIKFTRTSALILAFIFSAIICLGGIAGFIYWQRNMAVSLSSDASYIFNEVDLTQDILYADITNTFILSFIFTCFGMLAGFVIDTVILFFYILINIFKNNRIKIEKREPEPKKEKMKKGEDKKAEDKAEDKTEDNKEAENKEAKTPKDKIKRRS